MAAPGTTSGSKYKGGLHHLWWSRMSRLAPREVADRGHETPAQRAVTPPPHFDHVWRLPYVAVPVPTYLPSTFQRSSVVPFNQTYLKEQDPNHIHRDPSRRTELLLKVSASCEVIGVLHHPKSPPQQGARAIQNICSFRPSSKAESPCSFVLRVFASRKTAESDCPTGS
jgi:hypothetical protein